MKMFLTILALLVVGCGSPSPAPSGIDTATATCVKTSVTTAQGCYTNQGVFANLGANPCEDSKVHPECVVTTEGVATNNCCWNPNTNECFSMFGHKSVDGTLTYPTTSCSSATPYAVDLKPGDSICRAGYGFAYKGDVTAGTVCLPCTAAVDGPSCTQ